MSRRKDKCNGRALLLLLLVVCDKAGYLGLLVIRARFADDLVQGPEEGGEEAEEEEEEEVEAGFLQFMVMVLSGVQQEAHRLVVLYSSVMNTRKPRALIFLRRPQRGKGEEPNPWWHAGGGGE